MERWSGGEQVVAGDGVGREDLDPWQKFVFDIVVRQQQARHEQESRVVQQQLQALHMMLLGTAGTGKSRTVRATVRRLRELGEARGLRGEALQRWATLCAPTGCASFLMKYGAVTAHRVFGLRGGMYAPLLEGSLSHKKLQQRLRHARVFLWTSGA